MSLELVPTVAGISLEQLLLIVISWGSYTDYYRLIKCLQEALGEAG